ncbi:hypothetical protein DM794_03950 [Paenarthrobacter ureafaciens]|uniref:Uncharacterized protein n=1 Tax=Paenarthrobacter nitroguajacolicus TaxID=211146 RepID=A0A558H705_PAENT|nr:hypothetical protein [Paenarthrobacter ureafaciens]TVU64905.1 hypothetical protein FQP90_06535 [Paenarthrobacter nitroguajacolicus]
MLGTRSETSRTGHYCPVSGWWTAAGSDAMPRLIVKGEIMPAVGGTAVLWILKPAQAPGRSGAL